MNYPQPNQQFWKLITDLYSLYKEIKCLKCTEIEKITWRISKIFATRRTFVLKSQWVGRA